MAVIKASNSGKTPHGKINDSDKDHELLPSALLSLILIHLLPLKHTYTCVFKRPKLSFLMNLCRIF